eukprot:scaffold1675_cov146-Skeletonema_menzelii.AAC.21
MEARRLRRLASSSLSYSFKYNVLNLSRKLLSIVSSTTASLVRYALTRLEISGALISHDVIKSSFRRTLAFCVYDSDSCATAAFLVP